MELPTSNRKKLLTFDRQVLSQKTTLFPFFRRSYLGNRSTYIAENFHRILFRHYLQVCQISSKSEGWLANHQLVDLTRNDPLELITTRRNHECACYLWAHITDNQSYTASENRITTLHLYLKCLPLAMTQVLINYYWKIYHFTNNLEFKIETKNLQQAEILK